MTRLAILADLHGNLPALQAVERDLAQVDVDHVIVAGDLINWGPFSARVVERVLAAGWAVLRGNNEFYLLDYESPRAPGAWRDRQVYSLLPWLKGQLAGRLQNLIAAWPDSLSLRFPDAPPLRVVHGSPRGNTEALYPELNDEDLAAALAGAEECTVVAAHTHLPMQRQVGRWQLLNPGSVGMPLDGVFCARYLLLESHPGGWRPDFRQVATDPAPVLREFERQGFLDACGLTGHLVMEEFRTARLVVHPFMAWRSACRPAAPWDESLLDEYAQADSWAYTPPAYHLNR